MMTRHITTHRGWIAALLGLALSGCLAEKEDLQQWIAESGKDKHGRVEPLPQPKPYEPFVYDAFSEPDPFKAPEPKKRKAGGGLTPDFDRPREVLENYALPSLVMVGSLQDKEGWYALVRAPDGLHRVTVGRYLGQNYGRIVAIDETEIKLVQLIQDSAGDWIEEPQTLMLQEKAQGRK